MTEGQLQGAVIDAAHILRWKVAHFRPARTKHGWQTAVGADGKGFPDLSLFRERIVFAELKVEYRKLSAEQEYWRDWIIEAGGEWYQWREKDWLSGEIEKILR